MKKKDIKIAIERVRGNTRYSSWTIGITDDPERRKGEHKNPKYWHDWRADTETIARNVEEHFIEKGMNGDVGGGESPNYVYIF